MPGTLQIVYAEDMVMMSWRKPPKVGPPKIACPQCGNELECDYPKTLTKLQSTLGDKMPPCTHEQCPVLMHVDDPMITE